MIDGFYLGESAEVHKGVAAAKTVHVPTSLCKAGSVLQLKTLEGQGLGVRRPNLLL